ncbi:MULTISPECIES: hypothetical protein [Subtercola]|uniref:Uncharacterized protein n=1 Tax=Subtercola vilae TaxID=2056433 RepID=A0A4T2BTM3_9MICO|nr:MULTISPECIES: hypothetical protein [Subtercola]MEA9986890.1 hypothetical protein [Subtercola sp. RTI3]TIH34640.1 hypothetical protein D4765_12535 [Subtercola vilae]
MKQHHPYAVIPVGLVGVLTEGENEGQNVLVLDDQEVSGGFLVEQWGGQWGGQSGGRSGGRRTTWLCCRARLAEFFERDEFDSLEWET